jgi:hypothetical protein
VTYDHNGTENFADAFSFSVDDGTGTTSTGTFSITITPVNDNDPTITSDGAGSTASISIAENTTAVTTVTATDGSAGSDADLFDQAVPIRDSLRSAAVPESSRSPRLATLKLVRMRMRWHLRRHCAGQRWDSHGYSDDQRHDHRCQRRRCQCRYRQQCGTTDTVAENSAIGTTSASRRSASDPDGTDVVTYSLTNDAGGRFAIDPNTGVVTVAGAIDREAAASYDITIRATSTDTSFTSLTVTISISDVNESPVSTPLIPTPRPTALQRMRRMEHSSASRRQQLTAMPPQIR